MKILSRLLISKTIFVKMNAKMPRLEWNLIPVLEMQTVSAVLHRFFMLKFCLYAGRRQLSATNVDFSFGVIPSKSTIEMVAPELRGVQVTILGSWLNGRLVLQAWVHWVCFLGSFTGTPASCAQVSSLL